jgi:hypothetical protein
MLYIIYVYFQFRLVVKTSLKLLLVFVEYTESNTMLLLQAINTVDKRRGNLIFFKSYISCDIKHFIQKWLKGKINLLII